MPTPPTPPMPPNFGYVIIPDGDLDGTRFWLRVFQLEAYVSAAQIDIGSRLASGKELEKASVPIVSEYQAGQLYWYYAIVLFIDPLGLSGGIGIIYFADEAHRKEAEEKRNDFADHVMKNINQRVAEGKMTGTVVTIEPGKE
jgi:hypothetical protein